MIGEKKTHVDHPSLFGDLQNPLGQYLQKIGVKFTEAPCEVVELVMEIRVNYIFHQPGILPEIRGIPILYGVKSCCRCLG